MLLSQGAIFLHIQKSHFAPPPNIKVPGIGLAVAEFTPFRRDSRVRYPASTACPPLARNRPADDNPNRVVAHAWGPIIHRNAVEIDQRGPRFLEVSTRNFENMGSGHLVNITWRP